MFYFPYSNTFFQQQQQPFYLSYHLSATSLSRPVSPPTTTHYFHKPQPILHLVVFAFMLILVSFVAVFFFSFRLIYVELRLDYNTSFLTTKDGPVFLSFLLYRHLLKHVSAIT